MVSSFRIYAEYTYCETKSCTFGKIVVNEQLCLLTASNLGIKVPNSFIINSQKMQGENILFATERYDRKFKKENYMLKDLQIPFRLHQEDFAQAMGISSSMKYEKR